MASANAISTSSILPSSSKQVGSKNRSVSQFQRCCQKRLRIALW
ncbi:hypothetical protein OROGR_022065 [Orobanche gracilis]